MMRKGKGKPIFGLQATISLFVCAVVALALGVTGVLTSGRIAESTQRRVEEKATVIARTVAYTPLTREALRAGGDRQTGLRQLQTAAEEIRRETGVEFIVVMDMNGIRLTHPDPGKIGKPFAGGDEKAVLKGKEHISVARGTLGPSLRAFTPVFAPDGKQIGAVAVGLSLSSVEHAVSQSRRMTFIGILIGGLAGAAGALLLAWRIKKIMFGLEPFAIARLLEERSAMLLSAREGVIAVDAHGRITLINSEAAKLLHQTGIDTGTGENIEEAWSNSPVNEVLATGRPALDQELELNGIALLANTVPLHIDGEQAGAVTTFRDKTEIKQWAERYTGVQQYAEALRAQAHEYMNKLHVILGMVHMGFYDRLGDYVSQVSSNYQTEVGYIVKQIQDPVLAGFILGKRSHARELGADLILSGECYMPEAEGPDVTHELITVLGNLIDNALEATKGVSAGRVEVHFQYGDGILSLKVSDNGPGISETVRKRMLDKGFSTKGDNRGLGLSLVRQSLEKCGGTLQVRTAPDSEAGWITQFIVQIPYKVKGGLV